jgi:predicted GNAT family N-acyltransferase
MDADPAIRIRDATAADAEAISALLKSLSAYFLTSLDDADAVRYFAETSPQRIRANLADSALACYVAEIAGQLAGVVSTRGDNHILQFFVARQFQQQRVGRRLWNHAYAMLCKNGTPAAITVNASVFAVPIYGRFGFELAGERTTEKGVTFVPMVLRAEGGASG